MLDEIKQLHFNNHVRALAESNHRAAGRMQTMGGGFAAALGVAYQRADLGNQARILGAFGDLFEKFRNLDFEIREREDQASQARADQAAQE